MIEEWVSAIVATGRERETHLVVEADGRSFLGNSSSTLHHLDRLVVVPAKVATRVSSLLLFNIAVHKLTRSEPPSQPTRTKSPPTHQPS